MSDLIRRDDAIRALSGACSNWEDDAKVQEIVMAIPSAEGGDAEMNEVKSPYMQSSPDGADLISRTDAIEAVTDIQDGSGQRYYLAVSLVDKIRSLPSADAVSREEYDKLIQELNDSPKGKWIPLDGKLPKIIGEHVLVTIKWADDDLEVCEMCPTVADRYNIIAFQQMPLPYDGEPLKSELQCSGARMKGGAE